MLCVNNIAAVIIDQTVIQKLRTLWDIRLEADMNLICTAGNHRIAFFLCQSRIFNDRRRVGNDFICTVSPRCFVSINGFRRDINY